MVDYVNNLLDRIELSLHEQPLHLGKSHASFSHSAWTCFFGAPHDEPIDSDLDLVVQNDLV